MSGLKGSWDDAASFWAVRLFRPLLRRRCFWSAKLAFRRKSWVMAMPMLANARDVRSQARKVRSRARWSRATEPLFSREMEW